MLQDIGSTYQPNISLHVFSYDYRFMDFHNGSITCDLRMTTHAEWDLSPETQLSNGTSMS
jgi:hypothetical protein